MFTPVVDILVFLAATFLLGLALGWLIWGMETDKEADTTESEEEFWKQRYNQTRLEHVADQSKMAELEKEVEALKRAAQATIESKAS